MLAEILYAKQEQIDLVLLSDVDLELKLSNPLFEVKNELAHINDKLVENCLSDMGRLKDQKYAKEALDTIFLYSLTKRGRAGANKTKLLLGTLRPGMSANDIILKFMTRVFKKAWYLHKLNGEFAIQEEPNSYAILEDTAEDVSQDDAIDRIERIATKDILRGSRAYIFDPVRKEEPIPDDIHLKIVVSLDGSSISYGRFEPLFANTRNQNTLIVVVPADTAKSPGIIEMAKRLSAGEKISSEEKEIPEGLSEIIKAERSNLEEKLQDKYGRVLRFVGGAVHPQAISKLSQEEILNAVKPDADTIKMKIRQIAKDAGDAGLQVSRIKDDFYVKRDYPIITNPSLIADTLKELCKDKQILLIGQNDMSYFGVSTTVYDSMYVFDPAYVEKQPESASSSDEKGEKPENGRDTVSPVSIPQWAPINAKSKLALIDKVDRAVQPDDIVVGIHFVMEGKLHDDELTILQLPSVTTFKDGSSMMQSFELATEMDKKELLKFLKGLKTLRDAQFEASFEVIKK